MILLGDLMMRFNMYLDDLTPKLNGYYTILPVMIIRLSPYREYVDEYSVRESKIMGWDLSFHFAFWQWDLVIGLIYNRGEDDDN